MRKRRIPVAACLCAALLLCLAAPSSGPAQTEKMTTSASAARVTALLEKSGLHYTKLSEAAWKIPYNGKNLKDFTVVLAVQNDLLVIFVILADHKELKVNDALLTKLLHLNGTFDFAKLLLDDDSDLAVRIDIHARLLDDEEFKNLVQQTSSVADETYPEIQAFLNPGK